MAKEIVTKRTIIKRRSWILAFVFVIAAPLVFLVAVVGLPLNAQTMVTAGRNNLVVEKNNYIIRFSSNTDSYSLYKREIGKNRLVRLLNDRELRSTYIAIALNGRVYTLGRSSRYLMRKAQRLTLLTDGGVIAWRLPQRVSIKYYVQTSYNAYFYLDVRGSSRPDRVILAFDVVPSFSNLREFDNFRVSNSFRPNDARDEESYSETNSGYGLDYGVWDNGTSRSPSSRYAPQSPLNNEQRRSNELLEQNREFLDAFNAENPAKSAGQNSENFDLPFGNSAAPQVIPSVNVAALDLLYHSENKRLAQLQALQDNLELSQKLQQTKLQQLSSFCLFRSLREYLQAWRVQQLRLQGQLISWNTYLINILSQLPGEFYKSEVIKFYGNLRDLRLALRELSEQWSPLMQRLAANWDEWQAREVGEPPKRIENSLYQNQQQLVFYMNKLSDLARYCCYGVQQRLQAPLYGEMEQTLLAVRQHLASISQMLAQLYWEFSGYAEQASLQTDTKTRLQQSLFGNEQQLQGLHRKLTALEAELQVAFGNISLLQQWLEGIELNQSLLAYDPKKKEQGIKALLQQIGSGIDSHNHVLQKLQTARNQLQKVFGSFPNEANLGGQFVSGT